MSFRIDAIKAVSGRQGATLTAQEARILDTLASGEQECTVWPGYDSRGWNGQVDPLTQEPIDPKAAFEATEQWLRSIVSSRSQYRGRVKVTVCRPGIDIPEFSSDGEDWATGKVRTVGGHNGGMISVVSKTFVAPVEDDGHVSDTVERDDD